MGVEPFLVASSLLGVAAQRLIRRVCADCREPHVPSEFQMNEMGMTSLPPGATVFKAVGCPRCSNSGYRGRTVIHELMVIDDNIRTLIVRKSDAGIIKKAALAAGMISLRDDGIQKVMQGQTTVEELMRATHSEV